MDYEPTIGFVDAHSECNGGHYDVNAIFKPIFVHFSALRRVHLRVITVGFYATRTQLLSYLFTLNKTFLNLIYIVLTQNLPLIGSKYYAEETGKNIWVPYHLINKGHILKLTCFLGKNLYFNFNIWI